MKRLLTIMSILVFLFVLIPAQPVQAATAVSRQIESLDDNCRVTYNGSVWDFSKTDVTTVGYYSSEYYRMESGLRFTNITIPQGAKITKAYLTLTSIGNNSAGGVKTRMRCEDVSNAASFSNYDNFNNRVKTDAYVTWDFDSSKEWKVDVSYRSPNIKKIIQEVVNRSGWSHGNAIVVLWSDDGSDDVNGTCKRAYSYDYDDEKCAELKIWYEYSGVSVGDFESQIKELDTRIDELDDVITQLQSRASELSNVSSSLRSDFSSLKSTLNTAVSKIEAVRTEVGALRVEAVTIEGALERSLILEEHITELKGRLTFMTWTFAAILALMGVVMYGILRVLLRGKSYAKRRSTK